MNNDIENRIERILIALRSDGQSTLVLRSLLGLAKKLKADVCGLFVEDADLLHVANMPFSREIVFPTATVRNLDSVAMLRQIRRHADNLRQVMINFAQISNVTCTFRTREGSVIESALTEAKDSQLIILLPDKYVSMNKIKADRLELIINPAVFFYDESAQSKKALHVIRSLIEDGELHNLKVFTSTTDAQFSVQQYLLPFSVQVDYQNIDQYSVDNIITRLARQKPGLMILPLEQELTTQGREIGRLLDQLGCILVLVR
ncbi:MAG: hypothetical protein OEY87_10705 [Gammaproteobacteria bacterium]|nr:hypothetical protein [Gammaproteobacteria bacterium]MDH5736580.1 hypothetical protein [Gammaproteobacteria bacterium]